LLQKCHKTAAGNPQDTTTDNALLLLPNNCTTDARFYSSIFHVHGVDESVSLKSMRDITTSIDLLIRDWCGLVEKEDLA
jgi:hypothetical protein